MRANDHSNQGFTNWAFLTVQLWGENPHGQWKLEVSNTGGGSGKELTKIKCRLMKEVNLDLFSCINLLATSRSWYS